MLTVILGQRGTGKSTLLSLLVRPCRRLILVDTLSEHTGGMVIDFDTWADLIESYRLPHFRFILRELEPQDFDIFAAWCRKQGDLTLAIDEIDMWTKPQWTPPELERIVRYGRHSRVDLLVVARRPADVPRLVTSQADTFYIYRQTEPSDLKWIVDATGQPQLREILPALPDYAVAVWEARDRERVRIARTSLTPVGPTLQYDNGPTGERAPAETTGAT